MAVVPFRFLFRNREWWGYQHHHFQLSQIPRVVTGWSPRAGEHRRTGGNCLFSGPSLMTVEFSARSARGTCLVCRPEGSPRGRALPSLGQGWPAAPVVLRLTRRPLVNSHPGTWGGSVVAHRSWWGTGRAMWVRSPEREGAWTWDQPLLGSKGGVQGHYPTGKLKA